MTDGTPPHALDEAGLLGVCCGAEETAGDERTRTGELSGVGTAAATASDASLQSRVWGTMPTMSSIADPASKSQDQRVVIDGSWEMGSGSTT